MKTLAQQFYILVSNNLEDNEWFDGEEELAHRANLRIAKHFFWLCISFYTPLAQLVARKVYILCLV